METDFTNESRKPAASEVIAEVVYSNVDRTDFLDLGMSLWDRERSQRERTLTSRLFRWVCWLSLVALGVAGMLGLLPVSLRFPDPVVAVAVGGGGELALFVLWAILVRLGPRGFFRSWARDVYRRKLGRYARALEDEGEVINKARVYRFSVRSDGLAEKSELRRSRGGVDRYDCRESGTTWDRLKEVVVAGRHIFLVLTDGSAWALPTRAFPDEQALNRFLALIQGYQCGASLTPASDAHAGFGRSEGIQDVG